MSDLPPNSGTPDTPPAPSHPAQPSAAQPSPDLTLPAPSSPTPSPSAPFSPAPPPLPTPPVAPLSYAPDTLANARSLHPLTIVVSAVGMLKSLSIAIVLLIVFRIMGRPGSTFELIIAAAGAFQIVGAVLRYVSVRYFIEPSAAGDVLVVQSGILFRQRRAVPVARIQNINLKRDVVQRTLGVAQLTIDTAAGQAAEIDLTVLSLPEAERLRADLLARQKAPTPGATPIATDATDAPRPTLLYAAPAKALALAGATSTRVGAVVGAVAGLLYFVSDVFDTGDRTLARAVGSRLRSTEVDALTAFEIVAGLALLALLAGWLLSIATSLLTHWNFRLELSPTGKLTRRFGLLTLHEAAFPRHRLQLLTLTSGVLQRRLNLWRLNARTAGSYSEKQAGGSSVLIPASDFATAADLAARLVTTTPDASAAGVSLPTTPSRPDSPPADSAAVGSPPSAALPDPAFSLASLPWKSVSPRAIARWTMRNFYLLVPLPIALGFYLSDWRALASAPLLFLPAWGLAKLEFRATAYAVTPDALVVRTGVLTRHVSLLPRDRIQSSGVTANPIQRLRGLATLHFRTAAGTLGSDATIPHLAAEHARDLQDHLTGRLSVP